MTAPAERMKAMRDRRRSLGVRELRLVLPDARSPSVRQRVANEVARLSRAGEDEALTWIEAVSEFDDLGRFRNIMRRSDVVTVAADDIRRLNAALAFVIGLAD